ncbi:MAG TPA: hypothetical protein VF297_32385 [Pyrinomonadaceae bacterium]
MPNKSTTPRTLAPHIEEIARAIQKRIDGKPEEGFGTPNLIVRRTCTRLARLAGTRRLTSHSATFRRALAELQEKELPHASQRREVEGAVRVIAEWLDLTGLLPKPAPKPAKKRTPPKRIKGVKRIRVGGNWLEEYGIEMNDRLLVAMNGDIRPGEFGYFEVHQAYDHGEGTHLCHSSFFFLVERDDACHTYEWTPQEGVCLRTFASKCDGKHKGSREEPVIDDYGGYGIQNYAHAFGRVIGAERDGQPIETTLPIRPYDEREEPTPTQFKTTVAPVSDEERETLLASVREFGPDAIGELLRLIAEGNHSKSEILRRVRKLIKKPEAGKRIEELRERLRELKDEGEAHNESGIFKLEREIYDLEHPEEASDWNDWSKWEE